MLTILDDRFGSRIMDTGLCAQKISWGGGFIPSQTALLRYLNLTAPPTTPSEPQCSGLYCAGASSPPRTTKLPQAAGARSVVQAKPTNSSYCSLNATGEEESRRWRLRLPKRRGAALHPIRGFPPLHRLSAAICLLSFVGTFQIL